MASTMAMAAAHSMPPFPLPAVPRIRPPPIPKGTPGPNTRPQPGPPGQSGQVWADGRWANPNSRSALHKQEVVSKQLEKALQHEVHGTNIYAYRHMRTHQVVYSLTKNMDNTKIMKQLLFHGKKTVPAALRRDVWRPYFSVHFSKTPAGAYKGLQVFQELRELSALRQLSPPDSMTIATQADLDGIKRGYNPIEWEDKTTREIPGSALMEPPIVGRRLPPKWLSRRLMNQEATSVADVAAVLTRQMNPDAYHRAQWSTDETTIDDQSLTPQQRLKLVTNARELREKQISIRNHERLEEIRKKEEAKAVQLQQRQTYLNPKPGMPKIDRHTADRINIEYDGVGTDLAMMKEANRATDLETGAAERMRQAFQQIENEKRVKSKEIEHSMSSRIQEQVMQMTQAERDQIEQKVRAERAKKQAEIDAKVAEIRAAAKAKRAELYKQSATFNRTRALRQLSRESQAAVVATMKEFRTQHQKWVGPFAAIPRAVNKALAAIDNNWKPILAQLAKAVKSETKANGDSFNHEVEIRWANLRDGTHAESWPPSVFHSELQPKAVVKAMIRTTTTHSHLDAEGDSIETQTGLVEASTNSTIHVFGSASPRSSDGSRGKGRYESPGEHLERQEQSRASRADEWRGTEVLLIRDRILSMRAECAELQQRFSHITVNEENTPYIAACMNLIYDNLAKVQNPNTVSYTPADAGLAEIDMKYIRDAHSACLGEVPNSHDPIAEEQRVAYIKVMADCIMLELLNPESRRQADVRHEYLSLFNTREQHEDAITDFGYDARLTANRQQELKNFDLQHPHILAIYARRESALTNLPAEIEDETLEIERLKMQLPQASGKDVKKLDKQIRVLKNIRSEKTAQLNTLRMQEQGGKTVIRAAIREDAQAWDEFQALNRSHWDSYYESSPAPSPEGGKATEQPGPKKRGQDPQQQQKQSNEDRGMVMEIPEDQKGKPTKVAGGVTSRVSRGFKTLTGRGE